MKLMSSLAATCCALMPLPALAITYTGSEVVGSASAFYSITTNGVLGAVSPGDITAYQFTITVGGETEIIDPTNSSANFFNNGFLGNDGGALTATSAGLFFNYASPRQNAGFYNLSSPRLFVFGSAGNSSGDTFGTSRNDVTVLKTGNLLVATAVSAVVPEPATWAMMITGFGLVGAAMRRRKVAASFAQTTPACARSAAGLRKQTGGVFLSAALPDLRP